MALSPPNQYLSRAVAAAFADALCFAVAAWISWQLLAPPYSPILYIAVEAMAQTDAVYFPLLLVERFAFRFTSSLAPFTEPFDGESCDAVVFKSWDREESPTVQGGNIKPPIVSPAPPIPPGPEGTPFELCYEVNVLRFGETSVFGTDSDILYSVTGTADAGWARITMEGLLEGDSSSAYTLGGLPITGFSAEQYTNGELEGGVLANYGGLFGHKGSVCIVDAGGTDCDSTYTPSAP